MILHFIFLSRQQWAAFALSFTPSLLPFSLPNCSVCPLQYAVWLVVVQGRLLCGWLRKPSGLWTWCRYSCDAAALSPFFLLQTRSRWPMHKTSQQALCLAYPSPTFTLYCRQYCFSVCRLIRTAFVSVCLQGQHSGSVLQLSSLNGCSEMSGKLNVFGVAAQTRSA